jgi:hypothetical protein
LLDQGNSLLNQDRVKGKHIAPHTIGIAAMRAVLTSMAYQRLYDAILADGTGEAHEIKEKITRYDFFCEFAGQHGDYAVHWRNVMQVKFLRMRKALWGASGVVDYSSLCRFESTKNTSNGMFFARIIPTSRNTGGGSTTSSGKRCHSRPDQGFHRPRQERIHGGKCRFFRHYFNDFVPILSTLSITLAKAPGTISPLRDTCWERGVFGQLASKSL